MGYGHAKYNGNVGIGTTGPSHKLHVDSRSQYGGPAYFVGEDWSSADPATRVTIRDVTGGVDWMLSAMNDGKFALHQASVGDRLVVDNTNGNVGIGTARPGAKLHVGGTAGTDGIMFPDGTIQTSSPGSKRCRVYNTTAQSIPERKRVRP